MAGGKCPFGFGPTDPFKEARAAGPVQKYEFQGEQIPMILRHADLRAAAKDWATLSSDAPFRVPIPSEESVRSVRQLPLEIDPPAHTEFRAIVEPFFLRAKSPAMTAQVERLTANLLGQAFAQEHIEVVGEFALPLQSRALTYLLNVPEQEAELWTGWGIHVFRKAEGLRKTSGLDEYIEGQFARALHTPGDDFFSALTQATFQGRPLTHPERLGYANIAFAGGRDTIIHTLACALGHLAAHPEDLAYLREDPKRITLASEEFFRYYMPLTHIGRVCPVATNVLGAEVPAGGRVSLGWASANRDESVFAQAETFKIDRKPNPHLSFGFGAHLCLGAPHARLLLRTLLAKCVELVEQIEIVSFVPRLENEPDFSRQLGFEALTLRFHPRK